MNSLLTKNNTEFVGQKLTYFLATGNLISNTGLDLMQVFVILNLYDLLFTMCF